MLPTVHGLLQEAVLGEMFEGAGHDGSHRPGSAVYEELGGRNRRLRRTPEVCNDPLDLLSSHGP
jgi:hypothetical protein